MKEQISDQNSAAGDQEFPSRQKEKGNKVLLITQLAE